MILITGANGQLGQDIVKECQKRKIDHLAATRQVVNLTNATQIHEFFSARHIDAVIHCAAYTMVDKAEDEKDLCLEVNFEGTKLISDECKKRNIKFLFVSTDYVFDGLGEKPYEIQDPTHPSSVYGLSKKLAEDHIIQNLTQYYIVRIPWLFGLHGNNFIKTMLRIGKERPDVKVVDDQIGSPTYTKDLAPLFVDLVQSGKYGIYHASNEGFCSWADLADYVFRKSNYTTTVTRVASQEYPTKAKRPKNSRLSKNSLVEEGFGLLPPWQDAVDRFLKELENPDEN